MADVNARALTMALNNMVYLKGRFENGLLTVARFLALLGILVHYCFTPPDEEEFERLDSRFHYVTSVGEYAETVYLEQIIGIDGEENVILASEDITDMYGRLCGRIVTVSDDTWDLIQKAISESSI